MAQINGVLGPIDLDDLGFTLMHEHILIANWSMRQSFADWVDIPGHIRKATEEVRSAGERGVNTIVDLTPINLGRDIHVIREVAERAEMQVIAATGLYWTEEPWIQGWEVETLVDTLIAGEIRAFGNAAWHVVLPAFALALSGIGQAARLTRANMVETYEKPYIEMAQSYGFPERRIANRYAFKPSLIPSLSIIGLDFAAMLGNAFLVEAIFAWPGLSRYGVAVILRKDLNAIVGTVLIISATFLIANIIVDLLIAVINPRIRHSQRAR